MSEKNIFLNNHGENMKKLNHYIDLKNEIEPAKKYYGDDAIIFQSNPNYIKKDIILFKEEILKELNLFQSKITEKMKTEEESMTEKIEKFSIKIEKFSEQIIELSNLICTDKSIRDKVDTILEFKNKSQELIMTNTIQIKNLDKEFHENINRIDSILKDTVLYPGLFGGVSKFKKFHDFIDYTLAELSQGITFREKSRLDSANYKMKLDNVVTNLSKKIDLMAKGAKTLTEKSMQNLEEKMNSEFGLYNNKLLSIRMENNSYAEEMRKVAEDLLIQANNATIIKNELLSKFEEHIKHMKRDNSRVIKCFSGYKEQFHEMKRKYTELSKFVKGARFNVNIKEELNRRDVTNATKNVGNFKNRRKSAVITELNFSQNKAFNRRRSAINFSSSNDKFIKDINRDSYKLNFHFSEKELVKKDETVYENFLKSYKRVDSGLKKSNEKSTDLKKESKIENNSENKNVSTFEKKDEKDISYKNEEEKNKKNHNYSHHHCHHHHHKKKEKNENNNSKYDKNEEFIQRRNLKLSTISLANNQLNIPLSKLFDLTKEDNNNIINNNNINSNINDNDNKNDNNNDKFIRKNQRKLRTQKFDIKMLYNMKKLLNFLIICQSNSKINKNNCDSSFSSSSCSCSSCSKSYSSNSCSECEDFDSSYSHIKQNHKKSKNETKAIKEEEEISNNSRDTKTKQFNNNLNNIDISLKDYTREEKAEQTDHKVLTQKNRILDFGRSLSPIKPFIKNNTLNNKIISDEQIKLKNNIQDLIITNFHNNENKELYSQTNKNNTNNSQNNCVTSLKKISLTIEGTNKLVIKPNKENNENEKQIIKNVKNIINNNNKVIMAKKTFNGFPKIVTNNGERIIKVSHPVFHQKKFVNYTNPNVIALNYSIQALYDNAFKKKITKNNFKSLTIDKSETFLRSKRKPFLITQKNNDDFTMNNHYTERQKSLFHEMSTKNKIIFIDKNNNKKDNHFYNLMSNNDNKK